MLVAVLQKVVPSAYGTMIRAAMVCRAWRDASLDPALEMTWRQVCLRHSPVALATSESAIDYAYVCTPFNNPTIHSPLTHGAATTFRRLFIRRMNAARLAERSVRRVGTFEAGNIGGRPLFCCTMVSAEVAPLSFSELNFTFELFEHGARPANREYLFGGDHSRGLPEGFAEPLSESALASFAAPPHYHLTRRENLIWASTVRPAKERELARWTKLTERAENGQPTWLAILRSHPSCQELILPAGESNCRKRFFRHSPAVDALNRRLHGLFCRLVHHAASNMGTRALEVADVEAAVDAVLTGELARVGKQEAADTVAKSLSDDHPPHGILVRSSVLSVQGVTTLLRERQVQLEGEVNVYDGTTTGPAAIYLASLLEFVASEILLLAGALAVEAAAEAAPSGPPAAAAAEAVDEEDEAEAQEQAAADSKPLRRSHLLRAISNDDELRPLFPLRLGEREDDDDDDERVVDRAQDDDESEEEYEYESPPEVSVVAQAPRGSRAYYAEHAWGPHRRIYRRTTMGIRDGGSLNWGNLYRLVVSATRDSDSKMVQLADLHGERVWENEEGTGEAQCTIVPATDDEPELRAHCFICSATRLHEKLEKPGADEHIDACWSYMDMAESTGALSQLVVDFKLVPSKQQAARWKAAHPEWHEWASRQPDWLQVSEEKVAKALGRLQWS